VSEPSPASGAPPEPPAWTDTLLAAVADVRGEDLSGFLPPADGGGRRSAVLILLGEQPGSGPDVLLLQRASTLREHAGQPAFPGGARDATDADPAGTALREAAEEVAVRRETVRVLAILPQLWLPVSSFVVTPVLAWWQHPHPVRAVDQAEVASVSRVPLAVLADPANRVRVRHPSGHVGPAFRAGGMLVWGFTAGLLDRLLALGGWERPWDRDAVIAFPAD